MRSQRKAGAASLGEDMRFKSQSTPKPSNLEALESHEELLVGEKAGSFEQETNAALASQGLRAVDELHYQAKLQYLMDLSYEPIPKVVDSLFELLADNAPGCSSGELKRGVLYFLDKAANEAKRDLKSTADMDLPIFDKSKPWQEEEHYQDALNLPYTQHEYDCAPGFSREAFSDSGYLSHAPLFYVGKIGTLCNNWHVTAVNYESNKSFVMNYDFMPTCLHNYTNQTYGMGQMFNGGIDRNKLSQAGIDIQILYYLWYIAANMVKAGAIMPQLIVNYESRLKCWWIPAILSKEIRTLVTKVGLFLQGYEYLFLHRTDRSKPLDPLFLGQLMLSGFIQSYVGWSFIWFAPESVSSQPEYRILFGSITCDLHSDDVSEKALAMRLESWLSPLSMSSLSITPVLRFYDLADPEILKNARFMVLESEILSGAKKTLEQQELALYSLNEDAVALIDTVQDKIEHNWDLDELADGNFQSETRHNLSLEQALSSFSNTIGVGLELGFADLGEAICSELKDKGLIDDSGFVPLSLILQEKCCEKIRYECIRTASRLGSIAAILDELFKAPNNICVIPLQNLYQPLKIAMHGLTLLGVRMIIPRSLERLARPNSRVYLSMSKNDKESQNFQTADSLLSISSLLQFDWQLAVGEQRLSANEFKLILANSGKIVRFYNQFVYADPEVLIKIQKSLKKQQLLTSNKMSLLNAALSGKMAEYDVTLSRELQNALTKLTSPEHIEEPFGLRAVLRPYQKRGYEWLMHNLKVNIGSILADDMGLGKTLQVICALLKLKQEGRLNSSNQALIVVPTSLITNWTREINNFAPDLTVSAFYGVHSSLDGIKTDIILTSYGTARSRSQAFKKRNFFLIIVDEAQAIKNRDTAVHRALREFKADNFIAMSGTPVENHLSEYYSILDFANRGLFGTTESFKREFAVPIEKDHDMAAVKRFKNLTAPFIMRRLKTDKNIISDLPDKLTSDQFCLLTPNQIALYQSVVNETMNKLQNMGGGRDRSSMVLRLIQSLRAICNSPAQYEKSEQHYLAEDSGKVERLIELVDEIMEADGKALIFTQSVIMGNYLVEILRKHTGRAPQFLYGQVDIQSRMQMVDRFQNDPRERFMLLSLRAAGTGLNLTAANFVIHFDLWWNPAVENQATDRAYRIGQKKSVQVYRFICANTFEERINEMINNKRDLAELTVAQGETWIGDLSNRQLKELFSLNKSE